MASPACVRRVAQLRCCLLACFILRAIFFGPPLLFGGGLAFGAFFALTFLLDAFPGFPAMAFSIIPYHSSHHDGMHHHRIPCMLLLHNVCSFVVDLATNIFTLKLEHDLSVASNDVYTTSIHLVHSLLV